MFRQWQQAKREHPDALLLFRMGDFYELFFEDAEIAAPVLEIALTMRGKGTACEAPMCGVPYHAATSYIARLVAKGHRVAICEQMEDPAKTKGMVRREVVRVVTPGTFTDPERLDPRENNFLAALHPDGSGGFGIAVVDLSTGSIVLSAAKDDRSARDRLLRDGVREVIVADDAGADLATALPAGEEAPLVTSVAARRFASDRPAERLTELLGVRSLSGFGCEDRHAALPAAVAALEWLGELQQSSPRHLDRLSVDDENEALALDEATRRSLELVTNLRDGSRSHTLLDLLDRCKTPMGSRLVRRWLLAPLTDLAEIGRRQGVVEDFFGRHDVARDVRSALSGVRDVERLLSRAALGQATPADAAALRQSLLALPDVEKGLGALSSGGADDLHTRLDTLGDLTETLRSALADEPGRVVGDGRVVREGYDDALDEARSLARGGRETIAALEAREREATGIPSLKVKFNKVFGFFIEVSKSNLAKVPERYVRRQTLATAERYVTDEVKDLEGKILSAEERLATREREIFDRLVEEITSNAPRLRGTAHAVAEVDVLCGFAELALEEGYVRPTVDDGDRIEIEDGRHPVVERLVPAGRFVPNDCLLDEGRRLQVVTGPNMGGKSTYLRQTALIVLMAQVGSFVPARSAAVGRVDRIFSRVGASDNLAGGESTFMVEMTETANILHNASPQSLVILDEIGRGTATWDGLAIAWSVVEALHDDERLRPKALFATHYHELTALADSLARVENRHIAVQEVGEEIVFLHRVEPGPSDRSYGIHVARLAGLPDRVVTRAQSILERLSEDDRPAAELAREEGGGQLSLFSGGGTSASAPPEKKPARSPAADGALRALRELDLDGLTPRDALRALYDLRERLADDDS